MTTEPELKPCPKDGDTMTERRCKCGCGASLKKKHPNAKFLSQRHKDKYWNFVNPRGYGLVNRDEDDTHPFSEDAVQGAF